jgi:hypothetical protein
MSILNIRDKNGNIQEILAIRGEKGKDGQPGANGHTPVKGTDYWTEADKSEIVSEISSHVTPEQIGAVAKNPIYNATPSNITTIISNAEPGSTIILEDGSYDLLKLTGDNNIISGYITYPENLTITGTYNAKIAGVSITSGIKDQMVHSAYPHSTIYGCVNPDISDAILPQGLTFRSISFSNSFSLRNSSIDNLTFDDCQFMNGSFINVDPNRMEDLYGEDYTDEKNENFQNRPNYAKLTPKNLVVRDCVFNGTHPTSDLSAIRIQSVDGITIYKNIINQARYNGINIGGVNNPLNDSYSTGKISISNNQISNTQSRSIRLYTIRDAEVLIAANELKTANQATGESSNLEVVKASGCINTNFTVIAHNTYNDSGISEGNKITLESTYTIIKAINGIAPDKDGNIVIPIYDGSLVKPDTLILTNIGDTNLRYKVDERDMTRPNSLEAGETVILTGIKDFVYIETYIEFLDEESTFTNCTAEWGDRNRTCTITITDYDAVANVYAYD